MLLIKTVVITGAASGIGRALCEEFARGHHRILAIDCDPAGLDALKVSLEGNGARVSTAVADVSQKAELERAVDGQRVDIWVNNAGIHGNGDFEICEEAFYRQVVGVNLFGVMHGTRIALDQMEKRGAGTIVNMASVAGHVPSPFMSIYGATKHGVVGFTRSLQAELKVKRSNTRLILVSPGFVKTPLLGKDERFQFPRYLEWAISTPQQVSRSVVSAVRSGRAEVFPTLNGKVMRRLFQMMPGAAVPMGRMMLSESVTDYWMRRLKNPTGA
ncbi:MAG: SDR family oxidoreductase [Deltaproteobacteria bacterium]|nr:SDR family oxidoreductase [Deltaproteobacteria bacterium]MBI3293335.1 SDR family oxidoreductase [Deltaproteobacteria bacterium]